VSAAGGKHAALYRGHQRSDRWLLRQTITCSPSRRDHGHHQLRNDPHGCRLCVCQHPAGHLADSRPACSLGWGLPHTVTWQPLFQRCPLCSLEVLRLTCVCSQCCTNKQPGSVLQLTGPETWTLTCLSVERRTLSITTPVWSGNMQQLVIWRGR
jgi:hypothetical protein